MASTKARKLGRWGFVAMTCALGCATGTQGDEPALGLTGESGSAGTFSSDPTAGTGGSSEGVAGSEASAGTGVSSFSGFASGGTFSSAGTFSTAGTTTGGSGGGGTSSGGKGGGAGQGSGGGAGAGTGGKASGGAAGSAGSGGSKAGGTCANTKLTITSAAGSEERADLGPEFAIDGDMVTRWASEKSEPQTLDLDLGEVVTVQRVVINWEAAHATSFQLQIASNAAGPFTTIYSDTAGNGGTDDITTLTVSDGRYLRMNGLVRSTTYGFSIYELAVYGDKDETCQ